MVDGKGRHAIPRVAERIGASPLRRRGIEEGQGRRLPKILRAAIEDIAKTWMIYSQLNNRRESNTGNGRGQF
jgi:hypothetical protein